MLNSGILEMEEFENLVKNEKILVIDFSATWCGPCQMMAPIFEDIAERKKDKAKFLSVDVDSNPELAEKFKIEFVPTFIILKNGQEIAKVSGYFDADKFENFIDKKIAD